MTGEQFHDGMNHLDEDLIAQVDSLRRTGRVKRSVARTLIPAACLALVLLGGAMLLPQTRVFDASENANGGGGMGLPAGADNQKEYGEAGLAGGYDSQSSESYGNPVSYSYGCANMIVNLPVGWEYEIRGYSPESASFGIAFWPAGQEGKISVSFYSGFGVCGTGLEQEDITLNGHEAWMGTYDNHEIWDFIHFKDLPGSYVVMTEGVEAWWDTHGVAAMEILDRMELATDIMTSEEAITIAKERTDVEYDDIRAKFDFENGSWYVEFQKDDAWVDAVVVMIVQ